MADKHTNFAITTVATIPSPATSGTTCSVASGTGALFPAVPFNATVWPAGVNPTSANAEIVRVTNIAGDTFTITRAQEGTSARTWLVNCQIAATVTARVLTDAEYGAHGIVNVLDPVYGAIGDGVTDDTAAFVAALATGGPVYLPVGSYLITGGLDLAADGQQMWGPGTLLLSGAGADITLSGDGTALVDVSVNTTATNETIAVNVTGVDCALRRVAIVGDATDGVENGRVDIAASAHRCQVDQCSFDGTFSSVVVSSDGCAVTRNVFRNYRLGIYLYAGSANTEVHGNRFLSVGGSGITQGYDAILLEGTTTASVTGNVIAACREHGIYVAAGSPVNQGITVAGNAVAGHGSDGIKVLGADATTGAALDIVVAGNAVTDGDSTSGGITVGFCKRVSVTGNTVTGQNRGIFVRGGTEGVVVTGNVASRNGGAGIEIRDLSGGNVGVTVAHNAANDNDQAVGGFPGIYVLCSGGYVNSDLNVRGNECSDFQGTATQQQGISVGAVSGGSSLARVAIQNNTGRGNVGVLVEGAGLASITGLVIDGNYDGTAATVASASTITLPLDAPRVVVTGTTTITSITAAYSRAPVTLVFSGALTFTDGSNLKLAGNFSTSADDTITLVCDGTDWYEIARSVN